jgi:hypothetical protein
MSTARLQGLLVAVLASGCITPLSAHPPPPPSDFPLMAKDKEVPEPPVGDPHRGCAAPGETLNSCVDVNVVMPGLPPTTVRACEFVPQVTKEPRRVAVLQNGQILGCLVMTDLERWGDQLFLFDPRYASTGLLVFKHHTYANDLERLEILQVGRGEVHTVFRGRWLNFKGLEDLDGDGVPELLGEEKAAKSPHCDYIPTAVFRLKSGRFVRDDAAMERWAAAHGMAWWGPEPIIDGDALSSPFTVDCRSKLPK